MENVLGTMLDDWEEDYGSRYKERLLGERFQKLLEIAYKKTGLRCVVLVDEYDKPLLDTMDDSERHERNKNVFKSFFSRLKKADEYIQFVFITGVSRFHKISIFSDLNQLRDISLSDRYSALCGITGGELLDVFGQEIDSLAKLQGLDRDGCLQKLRQTYDGYRFHPGSEGVYNPYSLLNCFADGEFGAYWFATGTPSFLISKLRKNCFDVRKLDNGTIYASESDLRDYTGDIANPIPLLYQTGYLTITDFDARLKRYTLSFPNEEVKYGFLESLLPSYIPQATAGNGLDIFTLNDYIENGRLEEVRNVLTALFASISYTVKDDPFEHYFQSVIYVVFTLLGKFVLCEMHTYNGRVDCKVETGKYIYLFEFKRDDSAKSALAQIDSKDYALPFAADSRPVFKIGVSFDTETRKLVEWETANW